MRSALKRYFWIILLILVCGIIVSILLKGEEQEPQMPVHSLKLEPKTETFQEGRVNVVDLQETQGQAVGTEVREVPQVRSQTLQPVLRVAPKRVVAKQKVPEFELAQAETPKIYVPELEVEKPYALALPVENTRLRDSVVTVAKVRSLEQLSGMTKTHLELKQRMDRNIKNYLFVPKGTWIAGVQFSFWDEDLQDYDLSRFVNSWDLGFKSLSIAPYVAYLLKDDLAVGASFSYRNNTARIDNLYCELKDDFSLDLKNFYLAEKLYTASAFMRIFVGLGPDKRIGLFSDVILTYGRGTGAIYSGRNHLPVDVRQTINMWNIGMKPGLIAYITNNISLEASLGLFGFQYKNTKLFENGEQTGSSQASKANFKSNILSMNVGLSVYL